MGGWSVFTTGHGKVSEPPSSLVLRERSTRISLPRRTEDELRHTTMTQHRLLVTSVHCSPRISSQLVLKYSRARSPTHPRSPDPSAYFRMYPRARAFRV